MFLLFLDQIKNKNNNRYSQKIMSKCLAWSLIFFFFSFRFCLKNIISLSPTKHEDDHLHLLLSVLSFVFFLPFGPFFLLVCCLVDLVKRYKCMNITNMFIFIVLFGLFWHHNVCYQWVNYVFVFLLCLRCFLLFFC